MAIEGSSWGCGVVAYVDRGRGPRRLTTSSRGSYLSGSLNLVQSRCEASNSWPQNPGYASSPFPLAGELAALQAAIADRRAALVEQGSAPPGRILRIPRPTM